MRNNNIPSEYGVGTHNVPTPFTICIIQSVQDVFIYFDLNAVVGKHLVICFNKSYSKPHLSSQVLKSKQLSIGFIVIEKKVFPSFINSEIIKPQLFDRFFFINPKRRTIDHICKSKRNLANPARFFCNFLKRFVF